MKTSLQSPRIWSMFVASAALGAAAMFVLDPDKGRRRRALFRDKARRSLAHVAHVVQVSTRDLGHVTPRTGLAGGAGLRKRIGRAAPRGDPWHDRVFVVVR